MLDRIFRYAQKRARMGFKRRASFFSNACLYFAYSLYCVQYAYRTYFPASASILQRKTTDALEYSWKERGYRMISPIVAIGVLVLIAIGSSGEKKIVPTPNDTQSDTQDDTKKDDTQSDSEPTQGDNNAGLDIKKAWIDKAFEITGKNESPNGRPDYVFQDGTKNGGMTSVSVGRFQFNDKHSLAAVFAECLRRNREKTLQLYPDAEKASDKSWLGVNDIWPNRNQIAMLMREPFAVESQIAVVTEQYMKPVIGLAKQPVDLFLLFDTSVHCGDDTARELWSKAKDINEFAFEADMYKERRYGSAYATSRRRNIVANYKDWQPDNE